VNRALVVSPLLPYPPTSGGQKRTLRLLEAMARAELTPQVLTADEPDPAHVAALRARGWEVEVLAFAPGLRDRVAQHVARRPSPYLRPVAELLQRTAAMPAALVQLEHTMSAYYHGLRPGTPTILSLHNLDSELIATGARARRAGSLQWAREHSRALSTAHQERRAFAAADLVLCVSEHDATAVEALGGRALLVPNGVDADFFEIPHGPAPGELATFFGHFGYRPNREGLLRFLRHGWPRVLAARPQARLALAGPGISAPLRADHGDQRAERCAEQRGEPLSVARLTSREVPWLCVPASRRVCRYRWSALARSLAPLSSAATPGSLWGRDPSRTNVRLPAYRLTRARRTPCSGPRGAASPAPTGTAGRARLRR